MLVELRIRNLAVIEEVTVPFAPGLNVLTGETGAGKSIVIDALLLIAGARAQPDLIRSQADAATVEAVFDLAAGSAGAAHLEEAGHGPSDGQLVIRREIARSGRHRVFVNDSPATVALLERLGEAMLELHGQHEHQRLMEPARQLAVLDRFAGCEGAVAAVRELVDQWERTRAELTRLEAEVRSDARQEDLYRLQIAEIDAGHLKEGEEEELRAERRRAQHAERIATALHETMAILYDERDAAAARLSRASVLLAEVATVDPEAAGPRESLESAMVHLDEVVARVRALRDRAPSDPDRAEAIEARLDAVLRLKRKYGESVAEIQRYREETAERLDRIARHDDLAKELERRAAELAGRAATAARALTRARTEAAARLERLVQKGLRELGMEHARFGLPLRRTPAEAGELAASPEPWRIGPGGAETVEFLFSANPGEEPRPLGRVVSGGELSRTMLAVKTVLATADDMPTMVFDEVDAGIGGRVADVVADKLRQTAAGRQVLCVTHLAPIAARASSHLVVDKRISKGATRTSVRVLDDAGRVDELARMLGGAHVTDATRRHARELFRAAHRR